VILKVTVSSKISKERGINTFLDNINKKKVSDKIRQKKRKKKLQYELIVNSSYISEKDDQIISEISEKFEKTFAKNYNYITSVKSDLEIFME